MTKRGHSKSAFTNVSKRARIRPEYSSHSSSPGPSPVAEGQMQVGSPVPGDDVDISAMEISSSVNSRLPLLELPLRVKEAMESFCTKNCSVLYICFATLYHQAIDTGAPDIVTMEVFKKNVTRKNASSFHDLLNNAVTEKDWENVITHDVFWTELPANPLCPKQNQTIISPDLDSESSRQVTEKSWTSSFVCGDVVKGLEKHVQAQIEKSHSYARYCSIVQSSGMGKSRLLDEFSKTHFVIPVNLRESGTRGFPPPDVAVCNFLTPFNSEKDNMRDISYLRACRFLISLFIHTKDVVARFGAKKKEDRIVRFREFMSEGQRLGRVGEQREKFYDTVVTRAKMDFNDGAIATPDTLVKLLNAFDALRQRVCGQEYSTFVDIFIMFDEAHSLTKLWPNSSGLSNFTELQRALRIFSCSSPFTFFLATTGKISQSMPRHLHAPSNRIFSGSYRTPRAFIELGFDQLMMDRRIPDTYTTLEQVTSLECISHIGRPLWGTRYDHGDELTRDTLLFFAIDKLLGDGEGVARSEAQEYAILSQRLALDINSTSYISAPMASIREKILDQIANHMQVCVEIGEENENIRGIAASEPILSEAASSVMRNTGFQWLDALQGILRAFSINVGDRGELLVAAFVTQARDMAISLKPCLPPSQCCHHFSVEDLFESLFFEKIFKSMFETTPSICPPTLATKQLRFGKVASAARMHFNHFIKAQEQKVIAHQYLLGFIARGAAVLGPTGQSGFSAIFPYLFDTTILDKKMVGFIIVQTMSDEKYSEPDSDLFLKMDPFTCGLLDKSDVDGCFPIPIIRLVFALHGKEAVVTHMRYSTVSEGASLDNLDKRGEPRFISYDYWCSGIGPNLLQPVGDAHEQWGRLLKPGGPWHSFYDSSPAPDELRSQFPMGSCDESHWKRWFRVVKERGTVA